MASRIASLTGFLANASLEDGKDGTESYGKIEKYKVQGKESVKQFRHLGKIDNNISNSTPFFQATVNGERHISFVHLIKIYQFI